MERFDDYYFTIAKECGGIEGLLNSFFHFLQRRTDFYYECDPGDKMGFPPGVALKMVMSVFAMYQKEHYKKHPQKSPQEYEEKLRRVRDAKPQQTPSQQPEQPVQKQPPQQKKEADVGFNTYNGGDTDTYKWSQTAQDVTVCFDVPAGTTKKNVVVQFTSTNLLVKLKAQEQPLADGVIYDRIKQEDSVWSIEDGKKIILTLEKATENIWKTVLKGDKEIDATKVDNSKPLEDFDPETQGALRKIMYEQQRKNQGLPTTDEEKQLDALQKAWNAEGSPFKGQPFDPSKFNLSNSQFNV